MAPVWRFVRQEPGHDVPGSGRDGQATMLGLAAKRDGAAHRRFLDRFGLYEFRPSTRKIVVQSDDETEIGAVDVFIQGSLLSLCRGILGDKHFGYTEFPGVEMVGAGDLRNDGAIDQIVDGKFERRNVRRIEIGGGVVVVTICLPTTDAFGIRFGVLDDFRARCLVEHVVEMNLGILCSFDFRAHPGRHAEKTFPSVRSS